MTPGKKEAQYEEKYQSFYQQLDKYNQTKPTISASPDSWYSACPTLHNQPVTLKNLSHSLEMELISCIHHDEDYSDNDCSIDFFLDYRQQGAMPANKWIHTNFSITLILLH